MASKQSGRKKAASSPEKPVNGTDTPEAPSSPLAAAMTDAEPGNLDQVRAILFGAQIREFDKKFARLEARVEQDLGALKDHMRLRFDELETYVREEMAALEKRLAQEQQQRQQALEESARERQSLADGLRARLAELDAQHSEVERSLRERQLKQSKELSEEIQRQFEALSGMVREAVASLREEKTDRLVLADLFEELSVRLRDGLQFPREL